MKKVLFFIEDRMACRDFLATDLIPRLTAKGDIRVVIGTNFDESTVREITGPDLDYDYAFWPGRPAPKLAAAFLALGKDLFQIEFPTLTFAVRREYNAQNDSPWRRFRLGLARALFHLGVKPHHVAHIAAHLGSDPVFRRVLLEHRPDAVVYNCVMDRVMVPLHEARRTGIPLVYSVSSWDHLTTKGLLPVRPDHALVWSEEMIQEIATFHHYPAAQCRVAGALYMDICASTDRVIPREEFCAMYGIPVDRPILLFALAYKKMEKLNEIFIRKIHELIQAGAFGGPVHLIARASPKDGSEGYKHLEGLPGLTIQYPVHLSKTNERSGRRTHVSQEDRIRLSTIFHSSIVVCRTSSIVFDACLMDKPVVNLLYDAGNTLGPQHTARRSLLFHHTRAIFEENATRVVESDDQLSAACRAYLADPSLDRTARKALVKRVLTHDDGSASVHWTAALRGLLGI